MIYITLILEKERWKNNFENAQIRNSFSLFLHSVNLPDYGYADAVKQERIQKKSVKGNVMKKNLLIIGGTYFTGRVLAVLAARAGHSLTFLNRGKYSMKFLGDIKEYVCDRHDGPGLEKLKLDSEYDAVIDFCAYEPGDAEFLFEHLSCTWKQYIYFSTADVYARTHGIKTENSRLQQTAPADEVGLYTYKKMLLEKEVKTESLRRGSAYTVLRPAFIYGPYNYAPRESWYIQHIIQEKPICHPADATGKFQMVYVKDVAEAVLLCITDFAARNQTFNLSAPDIWNYGKYLELLENVSGRKIRTVSVTVRDVLENNIPLPFPLIEGRERII